MVLEIALFVLCFIHPINTYLIHTHYSNKIIPQPILISSSSIVREATSYITTVVHSNQPNGVTWDHQPLQSQRIQKIKTISLQKEILRDITASEFALRIDVKRKDTYIDYEKLMKKLDSNLEMVQKRPYLLQDNKIESLIPRMLSIKEELIVASTNAESNVINSPPVNELEDKPSAFISYQRPTKLPKIQDITRDLGQKFSVIVREDGTVDWDGAKASGKEVAKFGTELWERLNGKEEMEGIPTVSELFSQMQVKEPISNETKQLSELVSLTKDKIQMVIKEQDELKNKLRLSRKNGMEITNEDVELLRKLDLKVKELQKRLKLFSLNLDMERICLYIQQELESSIEPTEQKLFIAEVTMIDRQINVMMSGLQVGIQSINNDNPTTPVSGPVISPVDSLLPFATVLIKQDQTKDEEDIISNIVALIDEDEMNLIFTAVTDLKSRLGLDTQLVPAMDWGSLGVVVSETFSKIRMGLAFFSEGTKILFSDLMYAWRLLFKAVQGYTLKPREVNTIRRTGKDLLTLIPFTIILIIPLSPVGHVLVFSFIQRFFPDFFPSCYSERRLKLRKLFAEIERKNDLDFLDSDMSYSFDKMFNESIGQFTKGADIFNWLTNRNGSEPVISKHNEEVSSGVGHNSNRTMNNTMPMS